MSNPTSVPPSKMMLASLARFDKPAAAPPPPAAPVQTKPPSRAAQPALPDGEYNFIITRAELAQSRTSGNPMVTFQLKVLDPPHAGRTITKYRAITEKTVNFVRQDLAACGLQVESFVDLPQQLPDLQGRCISGRKVSQADGKANIYFKRLIPKGPQSEMVPDDLPF